MAKRNVPIDYTSRDFESIRDDLVNYARRYYPNTFKDFSEASFGSLMLDTVAYVGDVLSFYLDYQVNESFLDTANEFDNVEKLTVNDLDVGSAYYEQKEGNSSPQQYMDNELKLREANENRSASKNKIDKAFQNIVEE